MNTMGGLICVTKCWKYIETWMLSSCLLFSWTLQTLALVLGVHLSHHGQGSACQAQLNQSVNVVLSTILLWQLRQT